MEKHKLNNIFAPSECIPENTLLRYVNNELSNHERNQVEQHTINCRFCSDAIEGFTSHDESTKRYLKYKDAFGHKEGKSKKLFYITAVAASILIVLSIGNLFFVDQQDIQSAEAKELPAADSIKSTPAPKKELKNGDLTITDSIFEETPGIEDVKESPIENYVFEEEDFESEPEELTFSSTSAAQNEAKPIIQKEAEINEVTVTYEKKNEVSKAIQKDQLTLDVSEQKEETSEKVDKEKSQQKEYGNSRGTLFQKREKRKQIAEKKLKKKEVEVKRQQKEEIRKIEAEREAAAKTKASEKLRQELEGEVLAEENLSSNDADNKKSVIREDLISLNDEADKDGVELDDVYLETQSNDYVSNEPVQVTSPEISDSNNQLDGLAKEESLVVEEISFNNNSISDSVETIEGTSLAGVSAAKGDAQQESNGVTQVAGKSYAYSVGNKKETSDKSPSQLQIGKDLFEKEDYNRAILELGLIQQNDTSYEEANYWMAKSYLKLKNTVKAKEHYNIVIQKNGKFKEKAQTELKSIQ